jgi:hypothetical protein
MLSKVEQMNLDETVTFVEARETGKRDFVYLSCGILASQSNLVQVQGTFWRCGQKAHHDNAAHDIRKHCAMRSQTSAGSAARPVILPSAAIIL